MSTIREKIRNIAIIAHVDHGKTTLVDSLLVGSGMFRENQEIQDRIMDSNDIERERGITILSKNTAIEYNGYKINIVDTPGHADFGGEVERVLKMVNGVILVVDAFEGTMPQTKFVLSKAFELGLPAIVCINKIDRRDARVNEVEDEVLGLFLQLDLSESYLDSPFVYASARKGYATTDPSVEKTNMEDLFQTIIDYIPAPEGDPKAPLKLLISTTDYNDYVGRIGIGKIESGTIQEHDQVIIVNFSEPEKQRKVSIHNIFEFDGLKRVPVQESSVGSIVAVTGVEGINIGDTITDPEHPEPIEFVKISEPTITVTISVNDSPFAGKEGKYVTSRQLRSRLYKEAQTDMSLRVEDTDKADSFQVSGRGELHLSVLVENLRREGYEFQISKPEVIFKTDENGQKLEPFELVTIDTHEEYVGTIIEKLGRRKGELVEMREPKGGFTRLLFRMPARGLIGYRQEFLSDTRGNGVFNTEFDEYCPFKGEIPKRQLGSLIAFEAGLSTAYGLGAAQERGNLFIRPGVEVYEGMVIGSSPKGLDIEVNVCKRKQQTNIRSSASDEAIRLTPPVDMSLESLMEFIEPDELIEVTPNSLRLRKRILNTGLRYKSRK